MLPEQIVPFGVMGAFPFLVIGIVAARRQWRAPGAAQMTRVQGLLAQMAWRDFSQILEQAYTHQGYQVSRIETSVADLLLSKDGRSTLVACKRWKAANHGAETLRSLASVRQERDASHCVYVSIHAVTETCRRAALESKIDLLSGVELVALVRSAKAFA